MSRRLAHFNLVGVVALAVLCGWQWRENRRVHLELSASLTARHALEAKAKEQEGTIRGVTSDLDGFRERLAAALAARKEAERLGNALASTNSALVAERDQLRAAAGEWTRAVADRDRMLREADDALRRLLAERDAVVGKYNALAEAHNQAVARLNAGATPAAPQPAAAPRPN